MRRSGGLVSPTQPATRGSFRLCHTIQRRCSISIETSSHLLSSSASIPCLYQTTRRYATPVKQQHTFLTKAEQKRRNREKRIKKLLKDADWKGDNDLITADNFQYMFGPKLQNFTLRKNEEDSPHVKEFVYTATGQELSYDSLAKQLEEIAGSFNIDKNVTMRLGGLLQEIRDKEFDISARAAETIHENPKLSQEEKEWFGRFAEFSGELDEPFISLTNMKLRAIASDLPERQEQGAREVAAVRDRNEGRVLFKLNPEKEIYVGGHFSFTDEELNTYLPEGMAGLLPTRHFTMIGSDRNILFRRRTHAIIQELARRRENGFFGKNDTKSIVLDGPRGSGKSTSLTQMVMWARMNGWLVIWIPNGEALVSDDPIKPSKTHIGLFNQPSKTQELATNILKAHRDKLSKIKIKNTFKVRRFESQDKTLADLLLYCVAEIKAAPDCMYWFRRELNRVTEYPVMIAIDGYNHLYQHSDYWNPEDSGRYRPRTLNSQKLSLAKWFSGHEDSGLVNGVMVCALRRSVTAKGYFEKCGKNCVITLPNYSPEEFKETWMHYQDIEWIGGEVTDFKGSYVYALTEGNPKEVFEYCGTL